jgi:hypothetical protein
MSGSSIVSEWIEFIMSDNQLTYCGFPADYQVVECDDCDWSSENDYVFNLMSCPSCGEPTHIRTSYKALCSKNCGVVYFDGYDGVESVCECGGGGEPTEDQRTVVTKSFLGAYKRGREDFRQSGKHAICPYQDKRGGRFGQVTTFSRAFQRFWQEGFKDEQSGDIDRYKAEKP